MHRSETGKLTRKTYLYNVNDENQERKQLIMSAYISACNI